MPYHVGMESRYHRQMLLTGFGEQGQRRLRDSHALVVGCGALGSVIIDCLARAGVGTLSIIDRDIVESTNLQRQILYDESHVTSGMPKAIAARQRVAEINSEIVVNAYVEDFSHRNAGRFVDGADIILDGLDNFETRYLLNDLAVSRGLPYIYGGAVSTTGVSLAILPRHLAGSQNSKYQSKVRWSAEQATPCLRCVFPEAPPPGTTPTCDTAGVLGPVVMMIASHQATQALKLLTGNIEALDRSLLSIDAWSNETRRFDVSGLRDQTNCRCCVQRQFEYLAGDSGSMTLSLCGRNAMQITPVKGHDHAIDLARKAESLSAFGDFSANEFLLRGHFREERGGSGEQVELTLFPNGRAIIKGVNEPERARLIYARYIGA